jgi:hypothetical protein
VAFFATVSRTRILAFNVLYIIQCLVYQFATVEILFLMSRVQHGHLLQRAPGHGAAGPGGATIQVAPSARHLLPHATSHGWLHANK